jgi:hypothetical protein
MAGGASRSASERGSVGVLKIDTEGFELEVLRGGQGLLARRAVKFIYVEFNDLQPGDHTFGGALLPIDGILRHHGYRFIATYNDSIVTQGEVFVVSNALFALPEYTDGGVSNSTSGRVQPIVVVCPAQAA